MNTITVETKDSIRQTLKLFPNTDRKALATKHGVTNSTVGAIYSHLNRISTKLDKAMDKGFKTPKNAYNNADGTNKQFAREKMIRYIVDSLVEGIVPTLPHTNWFIESSIAKVRNMFFIGIERDHKTFLAMRRILKTLKLNGEAYRGDMSDKIFGVLENTYAHIILDYCGQLPTFAKEIEYALNNDIVKIGGIIAITFGKPIRGQNGMFEVIGNLGRIKSNVIADNRCMSEKATQSYFDKITGFNYELVEIFDYQDTYPMTLVIIKRIK